MSAFIIVAPYVGMGATSVNVVGNLKPHTILNVNNENSEITTSLDQVLEEDGQYVFKTRVNGDKIIWVLKPNANPQKDTYIPKDPLKDKYTELTLNKKEHYINTNL